MPVGPAAHDGEAQQAAALGVVGHRRRRRRLEQRQHAQADAPRVAHVAQEVRVLPHAGDAKRLRVGAHGHHELVVGHIEEPVPAAGSSRASGGARLGDGGRVSVRRRQVGVARVRLDAHQLARKVDVVGPALAEHHAVQPADGLEHGPELERAHRRRRQQRREHEVRPRRDDDPLELGRVQLLRQRVARPARAQDHHSLLRSFVCWEGVQKPWLASAVVEGTMAGRRAREREENSQFACLGRHAACAVPFFSLLKPKL